MSEAPPAYSGEVAPPQYGATAGTTSSPPQPQFPDEPPPSYESIFTEVRRARESSGSVVDFFKALVVILLSTIGCLVITALLLALPVAMIIIGSIHISDCPLEPYIPIYLVVGGCFGVLKNLSSLGQQIRNKHNEERDENARTNPFDGLVSCFLFAWFIAGNVWVFRSKSNLDVENRNSTNFCHATCYYFAYWQILSVYILIGTMCLLFCCVGCAGACFGGPPKRQGQANSANNDVP